jgi:YD repeat-containing protein
LTTFFGSKKDGVRRTHTLDRLRAGPLTVTGPSLVKALLRLRPVRDLGIVLLPIWQASGMPLIRRRLHALEKLTNVVEPGSFQTKYTYDALSDLLSVAQLGGSTTTGITRNRSFNYDSLDNVYSLNRGYDDRLRTTCEIDTGSGVEP